MKLSRHLKLVWLVIRKPMLVEPALIINQSVINGSAKVTTTITFKNGTRKKLEYHLIASDLKDKKSTKLD